VDQLLLDVDKLLEENRFSEARELLFNKKRTNLVPAESELINRALKKIELGEENYLQNKISMISTKRDMEQVHSLIEEERYEEAITKLDAMAAEEGGNQEILDLKQFAVEKLINRERNKAAQIYLQAKKTNDVSQKEAYLRESLDILKKLVDRYPDSRLNQKLVSNMNIVEEEIRTIRQNKAIP
jgi:hypothetical protein